MAKINQQDIAETLELSQTTVSRALANHPAINAETKAKVWAFAAERGYKIPPSRTRGTRLTREPIVMGVIIAIPKRERGHVETSQLILRGIAEPSSNDAVTLDVVYEEPANPNIKRLQKRVRQNRWKGCILIHPMTKEALESLSKTVSCVSVIENYRLEFVDSVDVDQVEAVTSLVQRLHDAGHRRIGYLSWVYDVDTPWVYHRFGAYVETLYQLGLPFDQERVLNLKPGENMDPEQVADRAVEAIRAGTTAFVCAADHQAYLMLRLLAKRGIRVPEDCSLTGFYGIEPEAGAPQLTTVRVPYSEVGRSAFHQLLRRINQPAAPRRHVMVDGEFLEGAAVAPPSVGRPFELERIPALS